MYNMINIKTQIVCTHYTQQKSRFKRSSKKKVYLIHNAKYRLITQLMETRPGQEGRMSPFVGSDRLVLAVEYRRELGCR